MSVRGYRPSLAQDGETGESSRAVVSHYSGLQTSSINNLSQDLVLRDTFSLNDVFSLKVEELNVLMNKVNHLGRECSHIHNSPRLSYLTDCSTRKNEEHSDILNKKHLFTEKLTDAVMNSYNKPIGIPKYSIQCYAGLASLVNNQYNKTKQEVIQYEEEMKKLKNETTQLTSQVDTFSELLDLQIDDPEKNENDTRKISSLFQEAKQDLLTVMSVLFKENVKNEFQSTMAHVIKAFVDNYECKEDQYVEIPARSLKLRAVNILINDNILVCHPSKKRMYALCVDD